MLIHIRPIVRTALKHDINIKLEVAISLINTNGSHVKTRAILKNDRNFGMKGFD